eukprot:scaffold142967_cov27-Attheya_sp.AAC.1
MHNPSDPCLEDISLSLFGSPSTEGETRGKDAVMVRARHTAFTDEADFVRAVGSEENTRIRKGRATLAVAQDDEMGACLSPYRRPVSLSLPPTVPLLGRGIEHRRREWWSSMSSSLLWVELVILQYVNGGMRNDRRASSLTLYLIDAFSTL